MLVFLHFKIQFKLEIKNNNIIFKISVIRFSNFSFKYYFREAKF